MARKRKNRGRGKRRQTFSARRHKRTLNQLVGDRL